MEGTATEESRLGKRKERFDRFPDSEVEVLDFSVKFPFSDVKLVSASGAVLYGSRYSLAVRSPVCKQMLLGEMKEAQSMAISEVVTIPFPGMRMEALQVLLEFCSSGFFSGKRVREASVDVIHAARYFQLTENMEELIRSVVAEAFGSNVNDLAETLSLALECLPTDSEPYFFQLLLKKIFSRSIAQLSHRKLSSEELLFLLSKTLHCSEPWATSFPFCPSELAIFFYVLQWSGHQISEDAGQRLEKLYDEVPDGERFDMDKCAPGTAEILESAASIARPFLQFIDFRLLSPRELAQVVEPLKVVPAEMLLEAFCHHGMAPDFRSPICYRGPFILQWCPDACSSGIVIMDGRGLHCRSVVSGFARTYSCFQGSGKHSWIVSVSGSNPAGIGVGFCCEPEGVDYSKWLGNSSKGWVLDGSARFWHHGMKVMTKDRNLEFGCDNVTQVEVQVTLNLDAERCYFTVTQAGRKAAYFKFRSGPGHNIPKVIYPAVSFNQASGQVFLRPAPL